jgi:hypothetical protein
MSKSTARKSRQQPDSSKVYDDIDRITKDTRSSGHFEENANDHLPHASVDRCSSVNDAPTYQFETSYHSNPSI